MASISVFPLPEQQSVVQAVKSARTHQLEADYHVALRQRAIARYHNRVHHCDRSEKILRQANYLVDYALHEFDTSSAQDIDDQLTIEWMGCLDDDA